MDASKRDGNSDISPDKVLEQTRLALAETQALHLIAHALIGFEDLTELLQAVIDSVVNVLAADRVALITFDLQAHQVVHFMKGGAGAADIVEIPFEELWSGLVGQALREVKPVLSPKGRVPDSRESKAVQRRREETHAGAIAVVPIRYQDNILGTLVAVNRPDQRDFNQWDVELMLMMASQCAIAIENARLYSELQKTNAELERRVTERTAELSAANARLQAEIVEHQQSAQALRASEERYRIVIENMSDGLTMTDENGHFAYVSQRFCDLSGYTAEELIGQPVAMLTLHQEMLNAHLARRRQGEHSLYQLDWKRKDGRSLSTLISGTPLLDDQGEFQGAFAIVTDITERIQAEEERLAHLRFFENMDQVNRAIQATHDLDEMMSAVLELMLTLFECDRAWLVYPCDPDAPLWEVPMERTRPEYPGALALKLKVPMDPEVASVARTLRSVDGPVKFGPQEEIGIPYGVEHGFSVRSFIGMALYPKVDQPYMFGMHQCTHPRIWTTEEQRLFQEIGRRLTDALTSLLIHSDLQESELRYREIFENTSDIIVIFDLTDDGRAKFLDISPTWEIMIGANRAELLGKFLDDFAMDAVAQRLLEKLHICLETKTPIDYEETITGTGYWHIHTTLIPVSNAAGSVYRLVAISRDITERKQAEEQRQKHHQELQVFFSQTIDGCFFMMLDEPIHWGETTNKETMLDYVFTHQHITRINDAMLAQYGATHEQMLELTPADLFQHNLAHGRDLWQQLFDAGKIRLESDERKLDETPMWIEGEYIVLYDGEGRITGHFGIQRDITERKQLEAALRRAHQNYATLVNSVDGIVWEADAQTFQFSFVSQQAQRILGYPVERWLAEPTFWKDHIHPYDQEWAVDFCVKSTQEKRPHDFEYRMLTADEEIVWLHDIVTVVVENDQPVQLRGVMVDITERKQMEAERRATEARFRAFVDHATDALFFHEWGTILDVNLQACLSLGYTREELIGMRPHDFDVDLDQAFMDQIEARLNAGEVFTFETKHRRKDGTVFPVEVRVRGFVQGESHFAVSVARDITERKQSEARMRALINAIPDMLVRYDREGRYLEIKAATSIPLNYAIPDAIGKTVSEMLPHDPRLVEHILRRIERALDTNEMDVQEYQLTYDGKTLYREARTTPINEHEVLMLIRDITERKEAEAGLQRYNQRLSILHRIDKGILSAQSPQEIGETVLEQLAQLIPCEFLSVILHNDELTEERIFALRHTPELGQYSQEIQPVVQNEVLETLKSGKTAVAPDLLQQAGSHARLALELESRGIRSALASPMMVQGKLIGTIALAAREVGFFTSEHQQITEEVAAQIAIALHQAKLNDQIRQHNTELEKRVKERTIQLEHLNRELELFSYSVSHDLRAPLRAIQGFAEIIVRRHRESLNEEGRRYFDHIVTASEQMNQLIIDLLDYARLGRQRIRLEAMSMQAVLVEIMESFENQIAETGAQIHLPDDLPHVLGDKTLLKRIFANLLQNALIYHQPGIPPHIDISYSLEPGYSVIRVTDNGIGIPAEFQEKIFNIFQRLHNQDQYPGTGIGLAIVRRSVELLNGSVWVESFNNVGSTFYVRFQRPSA